MKSSLRTLSGISQGKVHAWHPSELELAVPSTDPDTEKILALFLNEVRDSAYVESRSVLHRVGTGQNFDAWQPGEMTVTEAENDMAEWVFFGPDVSPGQDSKQSRKFEYEVLEEEIPQEEKEDEEEKASKILEQARLQAEEIILAAQAQADQLLLQAQDEIDEQKSEAYRQGREQALSEVEETLRATRLLVEEVNAWKTVLISQGEQILVNMLVEIAQKMFGEGVELSPEALQINLNRVMESAQGLGDLNIFMNPLDAKALDPSWGEYQMLVTGDRVKIIPSGKITRGGCFVKGVMGSVDGRVETQLNAILKSLEEQKEAGE